MKDDKANKWIKVFYECDKARDDIGDRKHIEGKVAYEMGKIDRAKKLFTEANKITKGRCFLKDKDNKYKKLIE